MFTTATATRMLQGTNIFSAPSEYCHFPSTTSIKFRLGLDISVTISSLTPVNIKRAIPHLLPTIKPTFANCHYHRSIRFSTRKHCQVSTKSTPPPWPKPPHLCLQETPGEMAEATLAKIPQSPRKSGDPGAWQVSVCGHFRKSVQSPILLQDRRWTAHRPPVCGPS